MPSKINLLLMFLLGLQQLAAVYSEWSSYELDVQRRIQTDASNSLDKRRDFLWRATLPNENIQFIPLSMEVSVCISVLKNLYYEKVAAPTHPKEKFMELVCSLTIITDTWQKSPNMKLRVSDAIFYEQKNTTQQFLDDLRTYFHAELFNVSFNPTDKEILLLHVREWIAKYTTERGYNLNYLIRDANGYMQFSVLTFTACWDKLKTSINSATKTLYFKTTYNTVIKVRTFNSKETIGYYNNSELEYEAIRLPFKNNEFVMIILLPYPDQPLLSISKFSIPQYLHLFGNVSTNNENIDYAIPVMNSPVFSLNENGTSINGDAIVCDSFPAQQTLNDNEISYKPFHVDRPFGVLIYDEKMRYILVHSWVKNPVTSFSNPDSQMQWNLFFMNY